MRRRRGYTRTVQSHFTLLILSRVAFLLPPLSPRRLHLCVPPPEPSTIQSSTFTFSTPPPQRARAHYAADTLLRPIEIFIPARLPSQFMPRTSEMYCYRRSTMLFSIFGRHCCAERVAGRPRRPFLFLHPLEHSSFPQRLN